MTVEDVMTTDVRTRYVCDNYPNNRNGPMNSVLTTAAGATRSVTSRVRAEIDARCFLLEQENAYLTQNNTKLRLRLKDLEASSLSWIRLYEAALERANGMTAECERLRQLVR